MLICGTIFVIFLLINPSFVTYAYPSVQSRKDLLSSLNPFNSRPFPEKRRVLGGLHHYSFKRDSPQLNGSILLANHRPNGDSTVDVYYTLGARVGDAPAHLVADTETADFVIDQGIYGNSSMGVLWPANANYSFAVTYSNGWNFHGTTIFDDEVGLYQSYKASTSKSRNSTVPTIWQTVKVADIQSPKHLDNLPNPQGVIGLAFNTPITVGNGVEAQQKLNSMFDMLGLNLTDKVLGLALQRWGQPGMDIGWWDNSRIDGDICMAGTVDGVEGWQVYVKSVLVGRNGMEFYDTVPYTAVLDSKYPALLLPQAIANAYYALVPESSENVYPCETKLPSLAVILKNECAVSVPGEALKKLDLGGGECMMAIDSSGSGNRVLTLGIPFFNVMYTVLNYTDGTVAVVQHAGLKTELDKLYQLESSSPIPSSTPKRSFIPNTMTQGSVPSAAQTPGKSPNGATPSPSLSPSSSFPVSSPITSPKPTSPSTQ